jgi:hypothetical protein
MRFWDAGANSLGAGSNTEPPNPSGSALDCTGRNVFNLNDGVYGRNEGQGSDLFAEDTDGEHCEFLDQRGRPEFDHVSAHGGPIIGLDEANVATSLGIGDGSWAVNDNEADRTSA